MKYLNLAWAIRQQGSQFRFAAQLGESESWLSRRMTGRCDFSAEDRDRVARTLGYPAEWLFETPNPPSNKTAEDSSQPYSLPNARLAEVHASFIRP
jgi:transcriptional regulator with XRE-family HTH domain